MASVVVAPDVDALAADTAERMTALIEAAVREHNAAAVCLTGGSTPEHLYELLADPAHPWRARIAWERLQIYWTDERHVPPDHPDSNYGMAKRTLLDHVPVPPAQIHRMRGELADAEDAAREYAPLLPAAFDVMLVGVGDDAHIASIFPGSPLFGATAPVAAVWAEHLHGWRITLTPPTILDTRALVVLVSGAEKQDAVYAGLEAPDDPHHYPVQLLRQAGDRVGWFVDAAAAARLQRTRELPFTK